MLQRHGLSQRRRAARETYHRYEWSRPGALLHVEDGETAAAVLRRAIETSEPT